MQLVQASRKNAKIKMGLQGPSGAGKTYSALLLAYGLCNDWSKIAVIDTENHSSEPYAHLGSFKVLHIEAPFSPERYIAAIEICEKAKMEVIIIDSISHEWQSSGGILEAHSLMTGNSYTNWSRLTPRHNAFVQHILQSRCHIIGTIRAKQDYVLSEKNGKQVPEKVGLKGITRDGMDFELTLVFDLNMKNMASASKDRTSMFINKPEFVISPETGKKILDWANLGEPDFLSQLTVRINDCKSIDDLLKLFYANPTEDVSVKSAFSKEEASLKFQQHYLTQKLQAMEAANTLQQSNLSLIHVNNDYITDIPFEADVVSTGKSFIEANTVEASFAEIRDTHTIPVFIKDNEPVLSHVDFIETTSQIVSDLFHGEHILKPSIRLSHPIKGRIPEAKLKPANQLLEHEKTLYYERLAFVIEIPSIAEEIGGNKLSLCVGGVKAYNLDNLYTKKGADEHFKVFIGFQNSVCTNLCIWTDGFKSDLKVNDIGMLSACIKSLFNNYNAMFHLQQMKQLCNYAITEQQFATLIGKCRMYSHLPGDVKNKIPPLLLGDTQISMVCKDYYRDKSFCKDADGNINLWKLYNLFTGSNKGSYIDTFLDRSVNAFTFTEQLKSALQGHTTNWFLN